MEYDEIVEHTVSIMRALHDLKEAVLFSDGVQPEFDAGMLEAASSILRANVDDEDPRVVEEMRRQASVRLMRAIESTEANQHAGRSTLANETKERPQQAEGAAEAYAQPDSETTSSTTTRDQ